MFERLKFLFKKEKKLSPKSASQRIEELYNSLYCEELRIYIGNDLTAFDDILTEKLWTLRERLFEETGFIMPAVRIMSEDILQENEYRIAVRGIVVYTGYAIFNADFAPDEIAKSLEDTLTQHIDDVFSNSVVEKYIDYVQTESHRLVSALLAVTDIAALRVILTNLLKDGKSIRNISLIFEKVCEYFHRETYPKHDPKLIAEFVKQNMPVI